MAKKNKTETKTVEQSAVTYTKEQILCSKKYKYRRDALGVVLADGKEYTTEEVDTLLDEFMKGKVN